MPKGLLELPVILLVSFALVFGFVRPVIAAPFYVGSESMVPTLKVWDRVLINKLAYDLEEPLHGDVALIKARRADRWGNLVYSTAARNFGPTMATAAAFTPFLSAPPRIPT